MAKDKEIAELARLVGERTANFYQIHKLCCSESVLLVMTQGFGAEMSPEEAIRLGSGFCGGMGGAGCTCGALAGAIMALGLFLGPGQSGGLSKSNLADQAREMHDRFLAEYGSACCRTLIEEFSHSRKLRKNNCRNITIRAAEIMAEIILAQRPELIEKADLEFLREKDGRLAVLLQKILQ